MAFYMSQALYNKTTSEQKPRPPVTTNGEQYNNNNNNNNTADRGQIDSGFRPPRKRRDKTAGKFSAVHPGNLFRNLVGGKKHQQQSDYDDASADVVNTCDSHSSSRTSSTRSADNDTCSRSFQRPLGTIYPDTGGGAGGPGGIILEDSGSDSRSAGSSNAEQHPGWNCGTDRLEGVEVVKLLIPSGATHGIEVSGGLEFNSPIVVCGLTPEGVAYRSGAVDVGDVLLCVNGIDIGLSRQQDVVGLLEVSSRRLQHLVLTVQHRGLTNTQCNSDQTVSRRIEIMLSLGTTTTAAAATTRPTGSSDSGASSESDAKCNGGGSETAVGVSCAGKPERWAGGFGFVLRGGVHRDMSRCRPLTVSRVIPGSPADREGTLREGDRIVAIDGVDVTQCRLLHAASLLTSRATSPGDRSVVLVVEYDVTVVGHLKTATGPVVVDIEKPVGTTLDVTLTDDKDVQGQSIVIIDSVYEAGRAERSGAVHVGDRLLSVDGVSTRSKSAADVTSLIQSNVGQTISLELLPVSVIMNRVCRQRAAEAEIRRRSLTPSVIVQDSPRGGNTQRVPPSSNITNVVSTPSSSTDRLLYNTSPCTSNGARECNNGPGELPEASGVHSSQSTPEFTALQKLRTAMHSSRSSTPSGGASLTFRVELPTDAGPLGVTVAEVTPGSEVMPRSTEVRFCVASIIEGGLADQTATLRVGDGLLSINGIPLYDKSLDAVVRLLEQASRTAVTSLRICRSAVSNSAGGGDKQVHDIIDGSNKSSYKKHINRQNSFDSAVASWECAVAALADSGDGYQGNERVHKTAKKSAEEAHQLNTGNQAKISDNNHHNNNNRDLDAGISIFSRLNGNQVEANRSRGDELEKTEPVDEIIVAVSCSRTGDRDHILPPPPAYSECNLSTTSPGNGQPPPNDLHQGLLINSFHHLPLDDDDEDDDTDVCNTVVGAASPPINHVGSCSSTFQTTVPPGRQLDLPKIGFEGSVNSELSRHHDSTDELPVDADDEETEADQLCRVDELLDSIFTPTPVELVKIVLYKPAVRPTPPASPSSIQQQSPRKTPPGILRSNRAWSDDGGKTTPTGNNNEQRGHTGSRSVCDVRAGREGSDDGGQEYYDDFGFSLSDGLYEKGVYVSAIRPGGPAAVPGGLQMFDKILQVNSTKTKDLGCHQVAPLIARSPSNQVQLIVCRNALRKAVPPSLPPPPANGWQSATYPRQPLPRKPPRHQPLPSDDEASMATSVWKVRPRVTFVDEANYCRSTVL